MSGEADEGITSSLYDGSAGTPDDPSSSAASFPSLPDDVTGQDVSTETTSVSWLDKIVESIVGVGIGLLLVVVCGCVLFWNEGRSVTTARSLGEGGRLVADVDPQHVDPAHDGKLVHLAGDLASGTPLRDAALGMSVRAARMVRTVEMYQWKEERHTETHKRPGGGEDRTTTYRYERGWAEGRAASEHFHTASGHENPLMRFGRQEWTANDGRLGAWTPGIPALERLPITQDAPVPAEVASGVRAQPGSGPASVSGASLYLGADPANPHVGDLRVSYRIAPLGPVSLIGRQTGSDIGEYQTRSGDRLLMAAAGIVPAAAMFREAEHDNAVLTWLLRVIPAVLIWVGFWLVLRPIATLGDLIPLIGSALDAGAGLVALLLALIVAPAIAGTAWLFYRPVVGLGLLAVVAVAVICVRALARRPLRRQAGPAMTPRPA